MPSPEDDPQEQDSGLRRRARELLDAMLDRVRSGEEATDAEFREAAQRAGDHLAEEVAESFEASSRASVRAQHGEHGNGEGSGKMSEFHRDGAKTATDILPDIYEGFSGEESEQFNRIIREAYEAGQVDLDRIVSRMIEVVGREERSRLETIARTWTHRIHETSRWMESTEIQADLDARFLHTWGFVRDDDTCDVCQAIMDEVEDGVLLEELVDIIVSISTGNHSDYPHLGNPKWEPMPNGSFPIPHDGCRHRTVRTGETVED